MIDAVAVIGGIGTILAAVAAAGMAQKWVWGYQLRDMREDRDFWRTMALEANGLAKVAVRRRDA